jgi:hypothetical protein
LVGVATGKAPVAFAVGGKVVNVMVDVIDAGPAVEGDVVVEPAAVSLVAGQSQQLRVYVVTKAGERIDRTSSALFSSADNESVTIRGDHAVAMKVGSSEIKADVPGPTGKQTGSAFVTVKEGEITELQIEPGEWTMFVGDTQRFTIKGKADNGSFEILLPHPDMKFSTLGDNPKAINIVGANEIRGMEAGKALLAAKWKDKIERQAGITVNNAEWTDLQIEPRRRQSILARRSSMKSPR